MDAMRVFCAVCASLLMLLSSVHGFSTLITFDVDGTLVSSSPGWEKGAHGRSFIHAVDKVLGRDDAFGPSATIPELLESHEFHGSTDGLILMRLARRLLGSSFDKDVASSKVQEMMREMYRFVSECDDKQVGTGIAPLPGVIDTLKSISESYDDVAVGLVTGNVEGIARRKMKALGLLDTNVFTSLGDSQGTEWEGVEELRFLGGFGSDYCSGSIDDFSRNHLDRGEQLAICVQRCLSIMDDPSQLRRIIHVGDAPADVLAARSYVEHSTKPTDLSVSVVGVSTGSYSVEELSDLCGDEVEGVWLPIVLEHGEGVGNRDIFLRACGLLR
mmetsp:Transcript_28572/g.64009  ORF Transcript_28572/g.64009 Transcript_28572/m.64009 type:complete len:329 (+) Transcript_28572:113-1099(+)